MKTLFVGIDGDVDKSGLAVYDAENKCLIKLCCMRFFEMLEFFQIQEPYFAEKVFVRKRKSKYGSQKASFNGRTYDSIKECDYAQQLEWRRRAGELKEVIPQYKLALAVSGIHITNYIVDFKVVLHDDTVEYHEVKGFETDTWRIKWRMALAIYGKEKFKLIK